MNTTARMNARIVIPHLQACERERHDAALKTLLAGDCMAKMVQQVAFEDAVLGTHRLDVIREALEQRVKSAETVAALQRVAKAATQAGAVRDGRLLPVNIDECDPRDVFALRSAGLIR
jgi:hypothetical protein